MDNYKTIETHLKDLTAFTGNSMRATHQNSWGGFSYKVYSYSTLIAEHSWDGDSGEWNTYLNTDKISNTTSRHQNLIRKAWAIA